MDEEKEQRGNDRKRAAYEIRLPGFMAGREIGLGRRCQRCHFRSRIPAVWWLQPPRRGAQPLAEFLEGPAFALVAAQCSHRAPPSIERGKELRMNQNETAEQVANLPAEQDERSSGSAAGSGVSLETLPPVWRRRVRRRGSQLRIRARSR